MYQVTFTPDGEADLARLGKPLSQRVLEKLRWLAEHFEVLTPEPLTGRWQGVFKLRVGDYRVLYTFDKAETKIVVHFVKHRRDVYRTK
jgi:mRNA interferase RelE/StbE